jgi:hypothetical protein
VLVLVLVLVVVLVPRMRLGKLLEPDEGCQLTCDRSDADQTAHVRLEPEQYRVDESAAGLAMPFEPEHDVSAETLGRARPE